MTTQMKMHSFLQWNSRHRLLVCRLYQTNSELANERTSNTCLLYRTQPYSILTRQYTHCLSRDTSMHQASLAVSDHLTVPIQCISTSHARNVYKQRNPLRQKNSRYVLTPELASLMVDKIWNGDDVTSDNSQGLIIDARPGPGLITKELLNRGAKNIVAVERNSYFMPDLQMLASNSSGRLKAYHGEYFMLSDSANIPIKHPWVSIADIFNGVQRRPWKATYPKFPVNVVGALPVSKEIANAAYLCTYLLQKQLQFMFGRVQHNLWMSEKIYRIISQEPAGRLVRYTHLSALYNICCHVKLLHVEPSSSFKVGDGDRDIESNLYLVQLTPKLDVFDHGLTLEAIHLFNYFLRQMLVHRNTSLKKKIEEWVPGHSNIIYKLNYNDKTRTGDVSGTDYIRLFSAIRQLDTFNGWMGDDSFACSPMALSEHVGRQKYEAVMSEEDDRVFADYAIH